MIYHGIPAMDNLSEEGLLTEHAIWRERHAEHFANVECGLGDEAEESAARDHCFTVLGKSAARLREMGYVLRYDDSRPRKPGEEDW